jgi:hypothetical protein
MTRRLVALVVCLSPRRSSGGARARDPALQLAAAGFSGALAGLFLPNDGDRDLSPPVPADGTVESELLLTAPSSRNGEFWRYGAQLDPDDGRTLRAWSYYLFRGEKKSQGKESRAGRHDRHRLRHLSPPARSTDGRAADAHLVRRQGVSGRGGAARRRAAQSSRPQVRCDATRSSVSERPANGCGRAASTSGSPRTRRPPRSRSWSSAAGPRCVLELEEPK